LGSLADVLNAIVVLTSPDAGPEGIKGVDGAAFNAGREWMTSLE
jgi:hypothetical protein